MPKVRGNKKAFLERQKDSKGLLCKSVTAHLNDWEDITADNETQTQNVTRTIADILNDKTIKSNRPFFYKGPTELHPYSSDNPRRNALPSHFQHIF